MSRHGRGFERCLEFFDVCAVCGKGGGDALDDAELIMSDDFERDHFSFCSIGGVFRDEGEVEVFEFGELGFERFGGFSGAFDAEDSRELAGEFCHAALEPVPTVALDDIGKILDKTGSIRANEGENEDA